MKDEKTMEKIIILQITDKNALPFFSQDDLKLEKLLNKGYVNNHGSYLHRKLHF